MQAALILTVKSPRGEIYRDFLTKVKLKTSKSPFNSLYYNKSAIAWGLIVSIVSRHYTVNRASDIMLGCDFAQLT